VQMSTVPTSQFNLHKTAEETDRPVHVQGLGQKNRINPMEKRRRL
jgi:hypothetical protein